MKLSKKVRDLMMQENLMFVYRGNVTNENSEALLILLEKEMEQSDFGFLGRKRLFMFVLESLQNVSRHTRRQKHGEMSLVVYSKRKTGYTVTTANVINNMDAPGLKQQLDLLNSLDADGIRDLYRKKLNNADFSEKGGAGLGLIEMAKKTGNKLDYDFIRLDDEHKYFVLSKSVDNTGDNEGRKGNDQKEFNGSTFVALENMMAKNKIAMLWSGHLSTDIEKQVLSFTETRMSEDDLDLKLRRKVFIIMVECLQNISKYNPGSEVEEKYGMPIAMVISEKPGMRLTTGNLIENSQVPGLLEKLKTVNQYDRNGLKELYRASLAGEDPKSEETGIMRLIDIARKSGHKLDYEFEKVNEEFSYYVLSVLIDITGKENQSS